MAKKANKSTKDIKFQPSNAAAQTQKKKKLCLIAKVKQSKAIRKIRNMSTYGQS